MEIDGITIDAFVEIWIYFNRLINRETYTDLRLTVKRRHERDIQQSEVVWISLPYSSLFFSTSLSC